MPVLHDISHSNPLAWSVLLAWIAALWWVRRRPGAASQAALLGISGLWLLVNSPIEGPTLVVLARRRGVTVADLLSLTSLGLVMWQRWRHLSARKAHQRVR